MLNDDNTEAVPSTKQEPSMHNDSFWPSARQHRGTVREALPSASDACATVRVFRAEEPQRRARRHSARELVYAQKLSQSDQHVSEKANGPRDGLERREQRKMRSAHIQLGGLTCAATPPPLRRVVPQSDHRNLSAGVHRVNCSANNTRTIPERSVSDRTSL